MTIVKEAQSSRVSAALDRAEARPVALDLPLEHDERLRRALESEVEKLVDEFGETSYANPARVQIAELGATGH